MQAYNIGISALRAQQLVLTTAGQNLANGSTAGYHRQRVDLKTLPSYGDAHAQIGSGVDVAQIRRLRDATIEKALLQMHSGLAAREMQADIAAQVERVFTPGTGSVHERLNEFFGRLEDVANSPANTTARRAFVQAGVNLADAFNAVEANLRELQSSLRLDVEDGVRRVNSLTAQLTALDRQIRAAVTEHNAPNALLDERDRLLGELATRIDVTVQSGAETPPPVQVGSLGYLGNQATELRVEATGAEGTVVVVNESNLDPVVIAGGRLSALLDQINTQIPALRSQFGDLATSLVDEVNRLHVTGLPATGGFQRLVANNRVINPSSSLDSQLPAAELVAGDLYVTVTQLATQTQRTERISFDPQSDSLQDLVNRLDGIAGLAAFIDPQGKLITSAETGYEFDFAGRIDPVPQTITWGGTSTVTLSGTYSGTGNDQWTYSITGNGQVGITPGVMLEVHDQTGNLVAQHDIGLGYEAGTALAISDGIAVSLTGGSVVQGDSLSSFVISAADESGVLSALGMNAFFVGSIDSGFRVHGDLVSDPMLLSLSQTGEAGDARIAEQLLELRTARIAGHETQSPLEALASLTADVGVYARDAESDRVFWENQTDILKTQQQSVSGVNADEELVLLIEAQRAYQAAARYLSSLSGLFDELMGLVG